MGENTIRATKIISKIVEANELEEASIHRLVDLVWHGYKFIDIKVRKDGIEHKFQGDWLVRLFKQLTTTQQALVVSEQSNLILRENVDVLRRSVNILEAALAIKE